MYMQEITKIDRKLLQLLAMADAQDSKDLSEDSLTSYQVKLPSKYKVILLNDDYTTMEFVIEILRRFFNKPYDEAMKIMYLVHEKGRGVCGVYPFEIAETKVSQVKHVAKDNGFPLRIIMEEE